MKFIPTAQDYLQEMEMKHWMNNGVHDSPPSHKKIQATVKQREITFD